MGKYIATLKEHIYFLKNDVVFLRKDLSEKSELIKSVFQNCLNPVFSSQKGLPNKDYQENKSHNNFTSNRSSHQRCSTKKGVLENLTKFTENTCVRVSFLINLQALGLQLY